MMRRLLPILAAMASAAFLAAALPASDLTTSPAAVITPLRSASASSPAELKLSGPATGLLSQPVVLTVSGLPSVDMTKTIGDQTKWIEALRFDVSAPGAEPVTLDKELLMSVSPWEWRLRLTLTPRMAGTYVVVCDWNLEPYGLALHRVDVGGSTVPPPSVPPGPSKPPPSQPQKPSPAQKAIRATYVFEKDQANVPRPVAAALLKLNAAGSGGFVASEFEEDTTTGAGQVPAQYKVALEAARKAGLPALVVEAAGGKVLRTIKAPTTAKEVEDAVK